jgi:hypothetical protein
MKKLLLTGALAVLFLPMAGFAAPPAQAPDKAVQAPTQAPVQAPNKTAQANANTGYRTYSYQPNMAPANSGYYNNRSTRYPGMFSGFQPADYKVRGQFNGR